MFSNLASGASVLLLKKVNLPPSWETLEQNMANEKCFACSDKDAELFRSFFFTVSFPERTKTLASVDVKYLHFCLP